MCFNEVVNRISPKLKGITHKLNGRFTFFNEDDLYQEAMIHLWFAFRDGKLLNKNDSYILQGCNFHLRNYIRKTCDKAKLVSLENYIYGEGESFDLNNVLSVEYSESNFENIDSKLLEDAIINNGLTEREKQVFRSSLDGLTTREIGSRLGISHVMVVKLRKKIKDKYKKLKI